MKRILYIGFALCLLFSCARMGSPDGGWYDDDPPVLVSSTPAELSTNVTDKKIILVFDEFIKLADASQNVIVSPPQLEVPEIKASGKKIIVELQDSLIPNTTYTIDFSDAISDNNENNPLGNYTYVFSTGEQIDTFEVSGYVMDAKNLEPIKGISVGVYADLADSAFRTKPLLRISRTDGTGHFVIKGVAQGEYRVYALQDADGDYKFSQKSEMIAFSHETYKPSAGPDTRQDTVWRDSLHIDNILRVPYTHFYPDDIVMLAFQEPQTDRFLIKQPERINADRMTFYFSYGNEHLPVIHGFNFDADSAFVVEATEKRDTITYWLRDSTLVNQDTLSFAVDYMMTDTLGQLVMQTDTMDVIAKTPYAKRQKELQKEIETWQKEQEKLKKRDEPYDSIFPQKVLEPNYHVPSSMDPNSIITIEMPIPLQRYDTTCVHLYSKIDSLWYQAPFEWIQRDSVMRRFEIRADWHPNTEYSFEVDSAAFVDLHGLVSNAYKQGIKVKSLDEYATVTLNLSGISDSCMMVQMLDKSDNVVKEVKMAANRQAKFLYVKPAVYYFRAFADRNCNGVWDTGVYDENIQPEDVYYCHEEVEAKEKWDITKAWNLTGRKRFKQKPGAITKQKADKEKKKLQNRNAERARKLGIEYVKKQVVK